MQRKFPGRGCHYVIRSRGRQAQRRMKKQRPAAEKRGGTRSAGPSSPQLSRLPETISSQSHINPDSPVSPQVMICDGTYRGKQPADRRKNS